MSTNETATGTTRRGRKPQQRVRMRDVADEAGVDQSIVSRVLSGDPNVNVRSETRERIFATAKRLDYRPNAAARSLRTARTMVIGMVVPDLANVVYASIARGVHQRALPAGYVVMVTSSSTGVQLREMVGRVDGVLVAVATDEANPPTELGRDGLPMVLVNRRERWGVPTVTVDDEAGVARATQHLISLGHLRIGHIAGPQNADTARRRQRGYERAMDDAGLPHPSDAIVETNHDEASGHAAACRLLDARPRPTAVVASNVLAAIGAMAAFRQAGLRIPEDISVVGFHDVTLAAYLDPPLTTVRMPLEEMGRRAVGSLLALINGERDVDDVEITMPPELVVRGSTAPPAAGA